LFVISVKISSIGIYLTDISYFQLPISEALNEKLKQRAEETNFISTNKIARLLLTNFANKKLNIPSSNPAQRVLLQN